VSRSLRSIEVIGGTVRELRSTIGWTQKRLGRRAGMSQSMVSLIENAKQPDLTFATADALVAALGGRLSIAVDAPYLGDRRRQREPAHARLEAHVARRLRDAGWEIRTEVEVGGDRSRGWIDVIAWHGSSRVLLVIELKTEIHDLGQIERSLGWYERECRTVASRERWRPSRVVGCLLLLATDANDARGAENGPSIAGGFPLRSRHLDALVRGAPGDIPAGRAIAMVDPRSRRVDWIRALRVDGRSRPAPYVDYAAFMRVSRAGRRRPR
jgi:transcriptional regulator with XRE-family HTH domain